MAPGSEHPEEPAEGGDDQVDAGSGADTGGTTDGLTAEPRTGDDAGSAAGSDADAQPEPS